MFILVVSQIQQSSFHRSLQILIASPGEFKHIKPCIIHENKYIDCSIQMPNMISAVRNEYPYLFAFTEIHQSSNEEKAYNQPAKLVKIDDENQTITFRWSTVNADVFPSGLKMLISGTLKYFGTTNLTIDITPSMKKSFFMKNKISNLK
jgi:hypothetical protein